jgi:hypothetical protein
MANHPTEEKHQSEPMSLEKHQPDPMLQMSAGRLGPGALALAAVVIAVILGVVFYGLNDRAAEHPAVASAPAPSMNPAAGGKANPPSQSAPQTNTTGGGKG